MSAFCFDKEDDNIVALLCDTDELKLYSDDDTDPLKVKTDPLTTVILLLTLPLNVTIVVLADELLFVTVPLIEDDTAALSKLYVGTNLTPNESILASKIPS